MTTQPIGREKAMTVSDVRKEPGSTSLATESEHLAGDPRALLAVRLLAAAALR